jgi:AmmeMemoRadiSam system protein B
MNTVTGARPAQLAGQWYPADSQRLADEVDRYISAAEVGALDSEVVAIMAPHAGYMYSGGVAGYAFSAIQELLPQLVVVISPMHQPHHAKVMTSAHTAYTTPLGEISVNRDTINCLSSILKDDFGVELGEVAYDPEHSLEIELPFLQRALKQSFQLLPLMLRDQSAVMASNLANAVTQTLSQTGFSKQGATLLVASTDLSHFYSQPRANLLDMELLKQVEAFYPEGVIRVDEQGKGYACGRGALAAVMWIAKALGASKAKILKYSTSGDASGEYDRVVGYAAAVFLR